MTGRMQRLGAAALIALLVVGILVRIAQGGAQSEPTPGALRGGGETAALFRGIPQRDVTLGDPRAPVTLIEFADLQCPFCRDYAERVLPTLVDRYVRTGKLKLAFRDLAFIGPDSVRAARVAAAAALQGRLWQFTDLVYLNQGRENSGFVTNAYLSGIARLSGVDADRALAESRSRAVNHQLSAAALKAERHGVDSTPSFLLRRGDGRPTRFMPRSLSVAAFTPAIDAALEGT
jgi:protein-disulfide isomerase